jgi:DMSO/TMAO reductase YedYZ heme-binding membrane subunit
MLLRRAQATQTGNLASFNGWWIVLTSGMLTMVLLWLGPDGSLADELGYALRVSARLAFIALLLALSSNRAAQQRLGRWWSRLHRFGMHYLWLVFMQAFVGIALTAGDPIYVALTVAGVLAFMLRAVAAMRHRLRRTA